MFTLPHKNRQSLRWLPPDWLIDFLPTYFRLTWLTSGETADRCFRAQISQVSQVSQNRAAWLVNSNLDLLAPHNATRSRSIVFKLEHEMQRSVNWKACSFMSHYGFFKHVQLDRVLSALSSDNREVLGQIYSDYLPRHLKAERNIAHVALR